MSRYIDADALLKLAVSKFKCVPSVGVIYCGNGEEIFDGEDLQDFIKAMPTADVAEVRHGEWIEQIRDYGEHMETEGFKCSVCGYETMDNDKKYCPNCGAKMDGGREECKPKK